MSRLAIRVLTTVALALFPLVAHAQGGSGGSLMGMVIDQTGQAPIRGHVDVVWFSAPDVDVQLANAVRSDVHAPDRPDAGTDHFADARHIARRFRIPPARADSNQWR